MLPHWFLFGAFGVALVGAMVWLRAAALRKRALAKSGPMAPEVLKLVDAAISQDLHTAGSSETVTQVGAIECRRVRASVQQASGIR